MQWTGVQYILLGKPNILEHCGRAHAGAGTDAANGVQARSLGIHNTARLHSSSADRQHTCRESNKPPVFCTDIEPQG